MSDLDSIDRFISGRPDYLRKRVIECQSEAEIDIRNGTAHGSNLRTFTAQKKIIHQTAL